MLILKAVSLGPLHGYGILRTSSRSPASSSKSCRVPSTLPSIVLNAGAGSKAHGVSPENNRRARFYALTAAGTRPAQGRNRQMDRHSRCRRRHSRHKGGRDLSLLAAIGKALARARATYPPRRRRGVSFDSRPLPERSHPPRPPRRRRPPQSPHRPRPARRPKRNLPRRHRSPSLRRVERRSPLRRPRSTPQPSLRRCRGAFASRSASGHHGDVLAHLRACCTRFPTPAPTVS